MVLNKKKRPRNNASSKKKSFHKNDTVVNRKSKRKEERVEKKKQRATHSTSRNVDVLQEERIDEKTERWMKSNQEEQERKRKKRKVEKKKKRKDKKQSSSTDNTLEKDTKDDPYAGLDPDAVAAIQRDDAEIAGLEAKLGIGKSEKDKDKLNREYAKLEGYGDDFGFFLDDLDGLAGRVVQQHDGDEYPSDFEYDSDESDIAAARAKAFIQMEAENGMDSDDDHDDDESSDDEQILPMKGPPIMDDSDIEAEGSSEENESDDDVEYNVSSKPTKEVRNSSSSDDDDDDDDDDEEASSSEEDSDGSSSDVKEMKDHDPNDTYRPILGQDLYGNVTDENLNGDAKPTKYVPPHLRKAMATGSDNNNNNNNASTASKQQIKDDLERKQSLQNIQRSLNNMLNRLSDNTLESVAKSMKGLYSSDSSQDVNECFWKNIRSACAPPQILMSGLIPVYMACVTGVHFQTGDTVQLGGHILENIINDLWIEMHKTRNGDSVTKLDDRSEINNDSDDEGNKEASNIMLLLCYLYNFSVIHCTLIYDIIRELIKNFTEQDVELLLLVLRHCGYQLRSDDPMALKEIVKLVQERALADTGKKDSQQLLAKTTSAAQNTTVTSNSRVQYMLSAIIDLKNNKRKKNDISVGDKISFYRKAIGRMKTSAGSTKSSDSCLRITLKDILNVETKGRWWKVGASWIGNQFHHVDDSNAENNSQNSNTIVEKKSQRKEYDEQDELLVLASKQRMNTDDRRTIFCIIMGGDDCEDAFEKLLRAGMLKGKSDRVVASVLVDCCGQEKAYNPYYAHLASRICEFQPKSSFTFKLAYFDVFKQFDDDDMKARKAANLAKLLVHLVAVGNRMNMTVLKSINVSPDDMSDNAVIFLTIFFTNIFESYQGPEQVKEFFDRAIPTGNSKAQSGGDEMDDEIIEDEGETLRESLLVFLLQYIKASPKNVKKSIFSRNLKAAIKSCEADRFESMFLTI